MTIYTDTIVDDSGYQRPLPGVTVYLFTQAGALAMTTGANPTLTDAFGNFTFNATDDFYTVEARLGGRTLAKYTITIGVPPQAMGPTGPANSTYTTLATLKAASTTNRSYTLVLNGGRTEYAYVTGDFTGRADDVNVVKLDAVPLATGALVRQSGQAVTYQLPATGSNPTSVAAAVARIPSVQDFDATPDNPDCSAAFLAARTWLETQRLATGGGTPRIDVPTGLYRYATSPNFGVNNAQMNCAPGTVFQHTGSGPAFLIDGGRADSIDGDMYRFQLNGQPTIMGNANSTYGLDMRGLIHCNINADVANVPVAAARLLFGVCSTFKIRNTGLGRGGQSIVPVDGFILDKRGQFEAVTACVLDTCILEQASGIGLRMLSANGCEVLGGTCESNGVGNIYIGANCADNEINGVDCEFSGQYDVACYGTNNTINLVISDKLILIVGNNNKVGLGSYNAITNSGNDNSFRFIRRAVAGGAFTDTGLRTRIESVFNVATQTMDQDKVVLPYGAWITDSMGNQRFLFGAGETFFKAPNGQFYGRNNGDQDVWRLFTPDGNPANAALWLNGAKVVGPRGPAIANATDAASTMAATNAVLSQMRNDGKIAP